MTKSAASRIDAMMRFGRAKPHAWFENNEWFYADGKRSPGRGETVFRAFMNFIDNNRTPIEYIDYGCGGRP